MEERERRNEDRRKEGRRKSDEREAIVAHRLTSIESKSVRVRLRENAPPTPTYLDYVLETHEADGTWKRRTNVQGFTFHISVDSVVAHVTLSWAEVPDQEAFGNSDLSAEAVRFDNVLRSVGE